MSENIIFGKLHKSSLGPLEWYRKYSKHCWWQLCLGWYQECPLWSWQQLTSRACLHSSSEDMPGYCRQDESLIIAAAGLNACYAPINIQHCSLIFKILFHDLQDWSSNTCHPSMATGSVPSNGVNNAFRAIFILAAANIQSKKKWVLRSRILCNYISETSYFTLFKLAEEDLRNGVNIMKFYLWWHEISEVKPLTAMFYKISSVCQELCRNIFTQDRKMDNLFVLLKASACRHTFHFLAILWIMEIHLKAWCLWTWQWLYNMVEFLFI